MTAQQEESETANGPDPEPARKSTSEKRKPATLLFRSTASKRSAGSVLQARGRYYAQKAHSEIRNLKSAEAARTHRDPKNRIIGRAKWVGGLPVAERSQTPSRKYRRAREVLLTAGIFVSVAAGGMAQDASRPLLPAQTREMMRYEDLSRGPMRVRLLAGAKTPGMMICMYQPGEASANHIIEAARRLKVGDSWFCGFWDPSLTAYRPYLDTGQPVAPYVDQNALFKGRLHEDKTFAAALDRLEAKRSHFIPIGVGEWENALWIWWEPANAFRDRQPIFGISMEEAARLDRKGFYDRVLAAHRRWKQDLHGRISSMNGYGMFSHLIGEAGADIVSIETGENIPATQVKRAFARGAARQFGVPWTEDVSPWFGPSISVGRPVPGPVGADGIYRGPDAGHSPSMLARLWSTAWFSGTACTIIEGASMTLFDVPPTGPEFPENAELSEYGRRAQGLFKPMKSTDIGVPYTPFGVLVNKHHGRWSVWGKPWGCLEETIGDKMTVRFFDQLFPGQSKGAGNEERYLCPSPYGDTFDVLVNDADRRVWGAYLVLLAVGDVPWTKADIEYLKGYVQAGGILCLNEINVNGWPRDDVGLAAEAFAPAGDAVAVLSSRDGAPLLIRHDLGKGCILVASRTPEEGLQEERAFPSPLLKALSEQFVPFSVQGNVEWLLNRTPNGWVLMLVNNSGFSKTHREAPKIDLSQTQRVAISYRGGRAKVVDLLSDQEIPTRPSAEGISGWPIQVDVRPGELRILQINP